MKQFPIFLILAGLVLTACVGRPTPNIESTVQAAITATHTAQPTNTPISQPPTNIPVPKPTNTPTPVLPTLTPVPPGISISGVITNLDEAKPYLGEASYLQLVTYSKRVTIFFNATFSEAHIESNLAKSPIPLDGVFEFQVENLEPGKYFVTAQKYKPGRNVMALIRETGNPRATA